MTMQHGYHYTPHKFLASILSKGLTPSATSLAKHEEIVYYAKRAWGNGGKFTWLFDEPCWRPIEVTGQALFSMNNHVHEDDLDFRVVELIVEYDSAETLDNALHRKCRDSLNVTHNGHLGAMDGKRKIAYHLSKEATILGHTVSPALLTVTRMWDTVVEVPVPPDMKKREKVMTSARVDERGEAVRGEGRDRPGLVRSLLRRQDKP